jgi:AcrR family transcriptional regulator
MRWMDTVSSHFARRSHRYMSKRTVYARYPEKAGLFKAAVQRAVDMYTVSREAVEAAATDSLESTLMAVTRQRIANIATPNGIKLQRILTAQSHRFPELFHAAFEQGTGPTIAFLEELFRRYTRRGDIRVLEPRLATTAFLNLAAGGPARAIVAGEHLDERDIEQHVRFAVRLFLDSVRPRGRITRSNNPSRRR